MMSLTHLMVPMQFQIFKMKLSTSQKTIPTNPPIHIYINRINNRLVYKIKDRYKLELKSPESLTLFCCTKKLIDKAKNGENVSSLKVVEAGLVQYNLAENRYQQKSEVLCTFTPNISYVYLLNVNQLIWCS